MSIDSVQAEGIARKVCNSKGLTFIKQVGEGAFKHAFQVQDKAQVPLALKIYKSASLSDRTQREIAAMTRCLHANIAQFKTLDKYPENGSQILYTIEEFLGGGSLGERLKVARIPKNILLPIAIQLSEALGHIASLDLVHRDIKPDNIMFREGVDTPVLVDFGLVRDLKAPALTPTWAGGPGSPFFSSPEQLNNEKLLIDWRSDQFGLGVTLITALTGRHPYQSNGETPDIFLAKVAEKKQPSQEVIKECREIGLEVFIKMVQPWPVSRFRSTQELTQNLKEAIK